MEDELVKMLIFIAYASEDRSIAEEIHFALIAAGHETFFDKANLPPGHDYHDRIRRAVERADVFVYLASPESVAPGNYALTELNYARSKWPHPSGRVVPVRLRNVSWEAMPSYLKAVTVLDVEGNIAAEVAAAVSALPDRQTGRRALKKLGARTGPTTRAVALIVILAASLVAMYYTLTNNPPEDLDGQTAAKSDSLFSQSEESRLDGEIARRIHEFTSELELWSIRLPYLIRDNRTARHWNELQRTLFWSPAESGAETNVYPEFRTVALKDLLVRRAEVARRIERAQIELALQEITGIELMMKESTEPEATAEIAERVLIVLKGEVFTPWTSRYR